MSFRNQRNEIIESNQKSKPDIEKAMNKEERLWAENLVRSNYLYYKYCVGGQPQPNAYWLQAAMQQLKTDLQGGMPWIIAIQPFLPGGRFYCLDDWAWMCAAQIARDGLGNVMLIENQFGRDLKDHDLYDLMEAQRPTLNLLAIWDYVLVLNPSMEYGARLRSETRNIIV